MLAASIGEIFPALLSPSVMSTTTRLLASESLRRLSEVASASPMAVPSSSTRVRSCLSTSRSTP